MVFKFSFFEETHAEMMSKDNAWEYDFRLEA